MIGYYVMNINPETAEIGDVFFMCGKMLPYKRVDSVCNRCKSRICIEQSDKTLAVFEKQQHKNNFELYKVI